MTEMHWREVPEPIRPRPSAADLLRRETREDSCEIHGPFTSERFLNIWSRCPKCTDERAQKLEQDRLEYEAKQAAIRLQQRIAAVGIPPRFADKTLDIYLAETDAQRVALEVSQGYVRDFPENLKAGRCLGFLGRPGTGKTHLACGIGAALAHARYQARYTTVIDYIRTVRETWKRESGRSEAEVIREYTNYHLLILDEVDVQFGSDGELTQLTDLVDRRYRELKPTLVISNCDPEGLERFLGPRAVDRLRENGGRTVVFDWKSWRGRKP
jgi:DNA replication protein DnaC